MDGKGGELVLLRFGHGGLLLLLFGWWVRPVREPGRSTKRRRPESYLGPGPPGFKIGCA
jgi:hypothetical protein